MTLSKEEKNLLFMSLAIWQETIKGNNSKLTTEQMQKLLEMENLKKRLIGVNNANG